LVETVSNEDHFTPEAEMVFGPYLASHCRGVNENSQREFSAHSLQAGRFWSKLVSNKVHLTLEADKVFRTYLASHCSGVTKISHVALHSHVLQAGHVCAILNINK
jgi:hypothetical protein